MSEDKNRFEEIIVEIKDLLDEALDLVPDGLARSRAESYWYSNMIVNVTDDHGYMGGSMCSMQDTLEEFDEEEDEEDYDHDAGRPAHMRDEDWD